jgi:hypothetical protein
MQAILLKLLPVLLPLLLGLAVVPAMQGLKKLSAWVEMQSPLIKRILVLALSAVATLLAKVTNLPVPDDILHMDGEMVTAILTALVAFATHALTKKPEA